MLHEQPYQHDCRLTIVDGFLSKRATRRLPRQLIFTNRTAVHLNAAFMCLVLIIFLSAVNANVADAEFPVTDCLLLSFNMEYDREHVGMSILRLCTGSGNVMQRSINVVTRICGCLWQHEKRTGIFGLNLKHGRFSPLGEIQKPYCLHINGRCK